MQNAAVRLYEERIEEAKKHILFHHNDADGYITIAKKHRGSGKFTQYHYRPADLAKQLTKYMGEDVYYSQNTFYKPQRRIENIRQLRSLYVDLDFYIFNYDPSWILGKLEHEFYGESIPEPNLIIFSGQGIVLIWLIEPVPHQALPLWQAVQGHFLKNLSDLGGDPRAIDAPRVFRIAGTTSSKNGETVHVQYRSEYRYELRQLQHDYLPELKPARQQGKRGRKKKIIHLFNVYSLNHARMLDLVKLVEMRDYEVTGFRETICFLYRYWTCCFTSEPQEALVQTLDLNGTFTCPLPEREVERATRSAEKAYEARSCKESNRIAIEKGYPGAGYNLSNAKIIKWLDISPEEMQQLSTIINTKEKRRRDLKKKEEKRRAAGIPTRKEWKQSEEEKTELSMQKIRDALEENPNLSIRKLAAITGLSKSYVDKLKKKI